MHYKPRSKSKELRALYSLNSRMNLPSNSKRHHLNLMKGFDGELKFDSMTEQLQCDSIILNDLLLKTNNTTFQIDSLIITYDTIYFYEVKNYEGNYYYEAETDKFFKKSGYEILNPLHQLARSDSLLTQLLHKHGFNIPTCAHLIFINDAFTLYQSPLDKPIIYPTQIKQHLNQLNAIPSKLNRKHKQLADKLMSLHINESSFTQLPTYEYAQLRKGIICLKCNSFSIYVEGTKCVCERCGHKEIVDTAVKRAVREFNFYSQTKKSLQESSMNGAKWWDRKKE
ncbi:nuclease-related domain-containing protein [Virgibacillus sp. CBA3643]|uniref:nuclease-related domain-containing protein n=1 Tax=Virgibacillus sp. CBA3643 TaxID=2942278 RepID=UPI0035A39BEB